MAITLLCVFALIAFAFFLFGLYRFNKSNSANEHFVDSSKVQQFKHQATEHQPIIVKSITSKHGMIS